MPRVPSSRHRTSSRRPTPSRQPASRHRTEPAARGSSSGVLLLTTDPALDDAVTRLSALAGRPVSASGADSVTGPSWAAAPLVIVGVDSLREVAGRRLPRRPGVLLVGVGARSSADERDLLRAALEMGAEELLLLPRAEARLLQRMSAADGRGRGGVLAVVGARGGAGATTLACALAVTAAREGLRTALVDADPLGGGVDLALGTEDAPGARWSHLARADLRADPGDDLGDAAGADFRPAVHSDNRAGARAGADHHGGALVQLLPDLGGLHVLSCDDELVFPERTDRRGDDATSPLPAGALTAVLSTLRLSSDLVVVDVPRQWSHDVGSALDLLDAAVLVTPAEVRAVAAAARVLKRLQRHVDEVHLVVRGPAPGGLPASVVADALGLRLAVELPAEPGLDAAYERGLPPARNGKGPLAECARQLLSLSLPGGLSLPGEAVPA